jgi:hypothetical protein
MRARVVGAIVGVVVGATVAIVLNAGSDRVAWPHDDLGFECAKSQLIGDTPVPVCPSRKQRRRADEGWRWVPGVGHEPIQVPPQAADLKARREPPRWSWIEGDRIRCVRWPVAERRARADMRFYRHYHLSRGEAKQYLRSLHRHPDC